MKKEYTLEELKQVAEELIYITRRLNKLYSIYPSTHLSEAGDGLDNAYSIVYKKLRQLAQEENKKD